MSGRDGGGGGEDRLMSLPPGIYYGQQSLILGPHRHDLYTRSQSNTKEKISMYPKTAQYELVVLGLSTDQMLNPLPHNFGIDEESGEKWVSFILDGLDEVDRKTREVRGYVDRRYKARVRFRVFEIVSTDLGAIERD